MNSGLTTSHSHTCMITKELSVLLTMKTKKLTIHISPKITLNTTKHLPKELVETKEMLTNKDQDKNKRTLELDMYHSNKRGFPREKLNLRDNRMLNTMRMITQQDSTMASESLIHTNKILKLRIRRRTPVHNKRKNQNSLTMKLLAKRKQRITTKDLISTLEGTSNTKLNQCKTSVILMIS